MRREIVLSDKLRGNYDVDNVKEGSRHCNPSTNRSSERMGKHFLKRTHSSKRGSQSSFRLRDRVTLSTVKRSRYVTTSSAQSSNSYQTVKLFRIKNRLSRSVRPYPLGER